MNQTNFDQRMQPNVFLLIFDGCKLTIPMSLEMGPFFKDIFTSIEDQDARICCDFLFDVALFFNLYL